MKDTPSHRNGASRQGEEQQQQDQIPTLRISLFTPLRRELCRQFVEMTTLEPGSELWVDQLLNFLMSRGQFGVKRESIKDWFKRQPGSYFRRAILGTGSAAGVGNEGRAMNSTSMLPESQIVQQQQSAPSVPMEMEMEMPIPIPSSSSSSGQVQTPAQLEDYHQKREYLNKTFEHIHDLHTLFTKQENLATCLPHLQKIQTICSRANNKLVLPSTYRENAQERLGSLSRMMKEEMENPASVDEHEHDLSCVREIPPQEEEEDDDEEIIFLS